VWVGAKKDVARVKVPTFKARLFSLKVNGIEWKCEKAYECVEGLEKGG
jgi:hypothetical protein